MYEIKNNANQIKIVSSNDNLPTSVNKTTTIIKNKEQKHT